MTSRHKVAKKSELLENGSRVIADVDGIEIAVFRYDDEYHAVANHCVHQGGPLCEGTLSGRKSVDETGENWVYDDDERYLRCPWHGWVFDITSGECADAPRYAAPTYEVEIDGGDVFVLR
jgi:nitrite reductase/ring-hydroxylating ferredoxin subunit